MRQTKKGNQWYFGMKMHVGSDAETGIAHKPTTIDNRSNAACPANQCHAPWAWGVRNETTVRVLGTAGVALTPVDELAADSVTFQLHFQAAPMSLAKMLPSNSAMAV